MRKLQDFLLIGVFVMTALLAAVAGLRAYSGYMEKKAEEEALFEQRKEEILARNAEAQNRVQEMQVEIIDLQEDVEALQSFIDQTVNAANEVQNRKASGTGSENNDASVSDSAASSDTVSDSDVSGQHGSVSGSDVSGQYGPVSGNDVSGQHGSVSGNDVSGQPGSVSGNEADVPDSVSGNDGLFAGSISGNDGAFDGSVSENDGLSVSGNSVSGNDDFGFLMGGVSENNGEINYYEGDMTSNDIFDEWRPIYEQPDMTLEERKQWRTSYQETLEVNQADREWIAENQYDFSQTKIACLGDSITKAANLEGEENYEQYAYPAKLQELLGAEEVYNLGIGGSSIGRYWADAFVDRYTEIPADSDIIIVMGGTNDGFCVSDEEFGSLDERAYHTFCGDLNELMSGLRTNYPDAQIFFATPLPNVLQDYLMSEREYLLPQKEFVEVIQTLADEYDFELIDLYNSNVLDSHDANVITEYMPDGVHGNPAGYQILAERFAGELVRYYNEDDAETSEENAASTGNDAANTGAAVNGSTGTNAAAGVGGNAGANAGAATMVGGNAGIGGTGSSDSEINSGVNDGTGNGTNAEGGNNGTDSGAAGSGENGGTGSGEDGVDTGNGGETGTGTNGAGTEAGGETGTGTTGAEAGAGGETGNGPTGAETGAGGEAGNGMNEAETGAGGETGNGTTGAGTGYGTNGGNHAGNGNGTGDGADNIAGGRKAGADTGTEAGGKNDTESGRNQYRYEY